MNATLKSKSQNLSPVEPGEFEIEIVGNQPPLIPEGEYSIAYAWHETAWVFNTPKIFVYFRIVDLGPHCGTVVYRAFRAYALVGKAKKYGRFRLSRRSELYLLICRLYEDQKLRPDRISLHHLKALVLKARLRTVDHDYKQRPLPEICKYSVVGEILGVAAGSIIL